jgi:hypothetical protein
MQNKFITFLTGYYLKDHLLWLSFFFLFYQDRNMFSCNQCDQTFSSTNKRDWHVRAAHQKSAIVQVRDEEDVVRKQKVERDVSMRWRCPQFGCSFSAQSINGLRKHCIKIAVHSSLIQSTGSEDSPVESDDDSLHHQGVAIGLESYEQTETFAMTGMSLGRIFNFRSICLQKTRRFKTNIGVYLGKLQSCI